MSERFANVLACLHKLKSERPDCQREVDLAVGMILGKRPNLEEKYDALLLKLDRSYSQLSDVREHLKQVAKESTMHKVRLNAKARVFCLNKMLTELDWMRARNNDLIRAAQNASVQKTTEAELSPEVPAQAD